MSTTAPARILGDNDDTIDALTTFEATEVIARNLKPGMVILDQEPIVDDLYCPVLVIDHKMKTPRDRSGNVKFLVEDVLHGGWTEVRIHANKPIKVAAR